MAARLEKEETPSPATKPALSIMTQAACRATRFTGVSGTYDLEKARPRDAAAMKAQGGVAPTSQPPTVWAAKEVWW